MISFVAEMHTMLGTVYITIRAELFLLHPKQFPLLGPVFGEAFAEFG